MWHYWAHTLEKEKEPRLKKSLRIPERDTQSAQVCRIGLPAKASRLWPSYSKGKKGHIVSDLKKKRDWPPWMHLQAQECGSYRAEDVVELLKKSLHYAQDPSESVVVLLDWFKAHRSPEVAKLIKDMGHVLLFHGGGTTGYTQVNDTHLHAALQRLLQLLEIQQAASQAQE